MFQNTFPMAIKMDFSESDQFLEKINEIKNSQNESSLFIPKTMNEWMDEAAMEEVPKKLFGVFWFQSEVCLLFADTNTGKSTLSYQIADCVSRGTSMMGQVNEAPPQKVLYFDFELSKKHIQGRYSDNYENPYPWHDNFLRVERNPDAKKPEAISNEEYLNEMFEQEIINSGAKIIIVDNITALRNETEKARDAIPLMSYLRALKNKHGLSILIISHTPKRDLSRPITENDMGGSKQLMNLTDNAFVIGHSARAPGERYLKQIKPKLTECIYGADNVLTCHIVKHSNFLSFEALGFDKESDHLRQRSEKDMSDLNERIYSLKDTGASLRDIGIKVGLSQTSVANHLKKREQNKNDDTPEMPF
jgi:archaellum biogenesis ATPase FlaH